MKYSTEVKMETVERITAKRKHRTGERRKLCDSNYMGDERRRVFKRGRRRDDIRSSLGKEG